MVDMSRMTGRKEKHLESHDLGNLDVMQSIRYVKGRLVRNVDLGRRVRQPANRSSSINTDSYDYDDSILRPQRRGLVDFSSVRGRNSKVKTENSYSYQHYDFDSYVWSSNSQVFPNTKTHVIAFGKQTNRYRYTISGPSNAP
jgi:hypothetical protein